MKPSAGRRFLQNKGGLPTALSPAVTRSVSADTLSQSSSASSPSTSTPANGAFPPNSRFDSSMALTVLVLLSAFFFMGFFSIYLCRFVDDSAVDASRRRRFSQGLRSSYSSKPKGLDPSAVRSLPLFSYGGDAKQPLDCAICLTEFEERETVKMIPYCHHLFHPECIDTWLLSRGSCPVCRSTQVHVVSENCSGAGRTGSHHDVFEGQERLAVKKDDTWVEEGRDVGSSGLRRVCSLSSLEDRTPLQRSLSF